MRESSGPPKGRTPQAVWSAVAALLAMVVGVGCSDAVSSDAAGTGGTPGGITGSPSGGTSTSTGGVTPSTGGTAQSTGGSTLNTGGTPPSTGGTASGTGGAATTGGAPQGGLASGGSSGLPGDGGKATGTGGDQGSGGKMGSGGSSGEASGGKGTGGAGTGGASTGGKGGSAGSAGSGSGTPGMKTVRVFWLRPTDVAFDQRFPDGIAEVVLEAQSFYLDELGVTFKVNDPVVEVVEGDHDANWYSNTPASDPNDDYWWTIENAENEVADKFDLNRPDSRWKIIVEVSAEGNGGGGSGWVGLPKHDADGAAGLRNEPMSRWYGGMVHEMGHMFGLGDSQSTDGTPMSASFYDYPDCHFSESQKNSMLNSGQNDGFFE